VDNFRPDIERNSFDDVMPYYGQKDFGEVRKFDSEIEKDNSNPFNKTMNG